MTRRLCTVLGCRLHPPGTGWVHRPPTPADRRPLHGRPGRVPHLMLARIGGGAR